MSQQWYLPYGKVRHAINTMPTQRTYTGQYTEAPGLGSLMFYNARYYSPALGRFVSADTLVPEPGNPQALNRFAYVLGNPLKYIDPSGHETTLCDDECDTGGWSASVLANDDELTYWGKRMKELYEAYRKASGWWNEDGEFTLEDFLVLVLYFEYGNAPSDAEGPVTLAATLRYWWWKDHTGSSNDATAIFNYAGTREVMRSRYKHRQDPNKLREHTVYIPRKRYGGYDIQRAQRTAGWVLNPDRPEYRAVNDIQDTMDWGNLTMYPKERRDALVNAETGLQVNQVVYRYGLGSENDFVVVTYQQDSYWKGD